MHERAGEGGTIQSSKNLDFQIGCHSGQTWTATWVLGHMRRCSARCVPVDQFQCWECRWKRQPTGFSDSKRQRMCASAVRISVMKKDVWLFFDCLRLVLDLHYFFVLLWRRRRGDERRSMASNFQCCLFLHVFLLSSSALRPGPTSPEVC